MSAVLRSVESLADVRRLARLYGRVWPGSVGLLDLLGADGECLLLVDEGGELVGYSFAEPDRSRGFVELQDIGIDPEHRGKGLGSRLLRAVQGKYERIKLIADATRPALIRFYEAAGFRTELRLENYYSVGKDGLRMSWSRPPATGE